MLAIGVGWAAETAYYTLTPATGSNNSYAGNCDVSINGITWNVNGNSQTIPWRIGGKSISNIDRTVYSKTAMGSTISKVALQVGGASSITVNSLKLTVASDANFSSVLDEVTATFAANSTINFVPSSGSEWANNAYYKFTFNVTVSGSSNKFVEFKGATFYSNSATEKVAKPTFSIPAGNYTSAQEVTISCATAGADIYWGTDGVNFASYDGSSILVNESKTLYAYAMKSGMDNSDVASAKYVIEAPAQPGEEVMFDYRIDAEFAQENGTTMNQSSKKGITIDFEKASGSNAPAWYTATNGNARLYGGNTLTIDAGQLVIESVTFTYDGNNPIANPEVSPGSFNEGVWTIGAKSGVLTVASGDKPRIATITVKIANAGVIVVDAPTISGNESFIGSTQVTITAQDGASIYYTTDGTDPTVQSSPYTGPFTVTETTTVKAIAELEGTLSSVASKTFTATPTVATITEFNALADNTVVGFSSDLVAVAQHGQYLYAQDDDKGILIYGSIGQTYQLGDIIPAGFTGTKTTYKGAPEMTNPAGFTASTLTPVTLTPIELTPSQVNLYNFGRYAVIKGATIANGKIVVADQNVTCYTNTLGISLPDNYDGKTYDIVGVCGYYNAPQFLPLSFTEVEGSTYPDYYLVGSFNMNGEDWVLNDEHFKFTRDISGNYYLNDVELPDAVSFKVIKVENGTTTWYGGTDSGDYQVKADHHTDMGMFAGKTTNYYMSAGGICDFVVSTNQTLTVNKDAQLFMKGTYSNDDWATKSPLTLTEDGWTITMALEAQAAFGFVDEWNTWKGGSGIELSGTNLGAELNLTDNGNFNVPEASTYLITINPERTKIVVNMLGTPRNVYIDENLVNGNVTASPNENIMAGETVTLTATPADGYVLDHFTVMAGETPVEVTDFNTFVMPNSDVVVGAEFKPFVKATTFKLATSVDQLENGKQILIAGVHEQDVYVMSAPATNSNNMTSAQVESPLTTPPTTLSCADGYKVLYLSKEGDKLNFYDVDSKKYLKATSSSSNRMGLGSLDQNAIALAGLNTEGTGTFDVTFQGQNTHNDLRFNYNSGNPIFNCYEPTNTSMPHVYLYVETSDDELDYSINYDFPNVLYEDSNSPTYAKAGDEVTVTIYAYNGNYVDQVTVTDASGNPVETTVTDEFQKGGSLIFHNVVVTFTMPASEVTVSATAGEGECPRMLKVNVVTAYGECSVENVTDPNDVIESGDRIRLHLSGYQPRYSITGLTVVDANGNTIETERDGESTFFFTMPATSVTATFALEDVKFAITTAETNLYTIGTLPENEAITNATVTVRALATTYHHYYIQNVLVREVNTYNGNVGDVVFTLIPDDEGWCEFTMPSHPVYLEATIAANLVGVSFTENRQWATWIDIQDLALPEGVEAYSVVSVQGDVAMVEPVDYIPAGIGVLLYSETPAENLSAIVSEPPLMSLPPTSLLLQGWINDHSVSNGYVLYDNQFVRVQDGTTISGHRCYLPESVGAQGAPVLRIVKPGAIVTGVDDLRIGGNDQVRYFDISGRYIGTSLDGKQGVFITSDGRKVVK